MNTHKSSILLITIICVFYVFAVHAAYDFHKLERTWIVRNTSNINENNNCPFVFITNGTQNATAKFIYTTDNRQDILATLEGTNGTIKLLNDKGSVIGNIVIFKDNVPYYLLIGTNTTGGVLPSYMVLTGFYQLPVEKEREITEFWNTYNATKNVTLYSTKQEPARCRDFLQSWGIAPIPPLNDSTMVTGNNGTNYPSIPKPGSGSGNNPTNTSKPSVGNNGTRPVSTHTPPKNASSCVSSNFLITTIFFHLCFYLKTFTE